MLKRSTKVRIQPFEGIIINSITYPGSDPSYRVSIKNPNMGKYACWVGVPAELVKVIDDFGNPSEDEDREALDEIARLLSAPEWPGASGLEDIAAIVGRVRDISTNPDVDWPRH